MHIFSLVSRLATVFGYNMNNIHVFVSSIDSFSSSVFFVNCMYIKMLYVREMLYLQMIFCIVCGFCLRKLLVVLILLISLYSLMNMFFN